MPGLYAAGDASDHGDMGANENIGPGMASAIVGSRAGKAAAKYAAEVKEPTIHERQVKLLKAELFAPLKRKSGLKHYEVRKHSRNV